MNQRSPVQKLLHRALYIGVAIAGLCSATYVTSTPELPELTELLNRTGDQTSAFLDQLSDVKCTEHVRQEKLGKDEKVALREESSYDYLVMLTSASGELNLSESRLPVHEAKRDRRNTSMLLSNGFSTLFLVFHPYYGEAFTLNLVGEGIVGARSLARGAVQPG